MYYRFDHKSYQDDRLAIIQKTFGEITKWSKIGVPLES